MKRNSSKPKRRYGDAGFTLVELVVVIAVLAILAGVGAVAYNGYIEYANKGVDRNTVGEIIHAIEVSGYSNATPDGQDIEGMIILSQDKDPQFYGSAASTLKSALIDAYGSLDAVRLSYDGWEGFDANAKTILTDITNKTSVKGYSEAIKDKDIVTSYAGNVNEIWDIVGQFVDSLNNKGNGIVSESGIEFTFGANGNYLDKIVTNTTDTTAEGTIKEAWKSGGNFDALANSTRLGARLARNFAFAMYAQKHPSYDPETMKEALETCKIQAAKEYNTSGYLTGENWKKIIDDYTTGSPSQAEIDALAYLGLMEAADSVRGTNKGDTHLDDSVYLEKMTQLLGVVDDTLKGGDMVNEIVNATGFNADGSVITVYAKSENGILTVKPLGQGVFPEEADPRTEAGEETITYNKKIDISGTNVGSGKKGTLVLDSTDITNKIGLITLGIEATDAKPDKEGIVEVTKSSDNRSVSVTGIAPGNVTITITAHARETHTWTIDVTVY